MSDAQDIQDVINNMSTMEEIVGGMDLGRKVIALKHLSDMKELLRGILGTNRPLSEWLIVESGVLFIPVFEKFQEKHP